MNRRALLVSVVLALLGSVLLVLYMRRFERDMSGGETVELLTMLKPVERGKAITDDVLGTRSVPLAYEGTQPARRSLRNIRSVWLRPNGSVSCLERLVRTANA